LNTLHLVTCSNNDLGILAVMNKQLIEDEQYDNPMSIDELKNRMEGFITSDYKAYLFKEQEIIRGYALVNHSRSPLYLRQFFICRDSRRQRFGRVAFELLMRHLQTSEIDLEVMSWNKTGHEFWKSIGFVERSIFMRHIGRAEPEG